MQRDNYKKNIYDYNKDQEAFKRGIRMYDAYNFDSDGLMVNVLC